MWGRALRSNGGLRGSCHLSLAGCLLLTPRLFVPVPALPCPHRESRAPAGCGSPAAGFPSRGDQYPLHRPWSGSQGRAVSTWAWPAQLPRASTVVSARWVAARGDMHCDMQAVWVTILPHVCRCQLGFGMRVLESQHNSLWALLKASGMGPESACPGLLSPVNGKV